ncbi:MAG: penicillin-binding protein 1C [Helicobacteraceae bacterium]|jgi:penicillin-binding protein 1C|nr:penicillin-binding protein 1C [Helicobacteraceae bacterium]
MQKVKNVLLVVCVILPALLITLDNLFPLPLKEARMARVVLSDDGTPLWRFADGNGVWRFPVSIDEVSPYYIDALLAYEDRYFYHHFGINPVSVVRAFFQNLYSGKIVSGASTLTMQTARLIEPHRRTLLGKTRQLWRALQLEWHLSKDEILTIYLNRAPFGGTIEGIRAAAWSYLGKEPAELSRAEAALMVALPQAPSRLRPDRFPKEAQNARDKVLDRLLKFGVFSEEQVKDAKEEDIYLPPRFVPQLAPLFARRTLAMTDDLVIETNIDAAMQENLEDIARNAKSALRPATSLAFLVVDHTDMSVKAYVGSADINDESRFGHVDMVSAIRSPGSTLKPFIYTLAIDEGLIHSESLLLDTPRIASYRPANFSTAFSGAASASQALEKSLNLPAVQLMEAYGPKRFTAKLSNAGIKLALPRHGEPNLSIILGGVGISLDRLVSAYSAFARGGSISPLRYLKGDDLASYDFVGAGAAWVTRRMLSGEADPAFYRHGFVSMAYKTGTSYGYRDAWAVGISSRYIIGVWVGRPDGTPVAEQFGAAVAVPFLLRINNYLHSRAISSFIINYSLDEMPASVGSASICWPSGQPLPKGDPNCRVEKRAWIVNGVTPPTLLSNTQDFLMGGWYTYYEDDRHERVAFDCKNAVKKRLALWPVALSPWLSAGEQISRRLPKKSKICPPSEESELVRPLFIKEVKDGDIFTKHKSETLLIPAISSQGGSGTRWWFLNGDLIAQNGENDFLSYTFTKNGGYQLVVMDESGQSYKVEFGVEGIE